MPLAGGTDLMVALNFRHARPGAVLDLTRVPELREWAPDDGRVRVGAGVTYTRLIEELGDRLPGLAIASRTVGSLQIRNRGTVGGNLATASPAGDGLPPLYTSDAVVEVASTRGTRRIPVAEFVTGPKRTCLAERRADRRAFDLRRRRRPAAVRQGRHAQRDGDRRLLGQPRAVAASERRVAACVGSVGPDAAARARGRGVHRRRARRGRPLGAARPAARRGGRALRRAGRRGRAADRRRARHRRLPPPRGRACSRGARSRWTWEARA